MTNSRRLYDACFHAAVAASQAFIAVVAGGCRGFRALVVTGSGMPVERLGDYRTQLCFIRLLHLRSSLVVWALRFGTVLPLSRSGI